MDYSKHLEPLPILHGRSSFQVTFMRQGEAQGKAPKKLLSFAPRSRLKILIFKSNIDLLLLPANIVLIHL